MFQPQPAQRRHRRLPSGTMVSYAEVKNYLSKREIPQLFESLMAGLMYHRPENHIGYLQTCLDEVKTHSDTKVHWSTFVNKKRKSKEILPPLTPPKKQESFSSSWSDNSRQSTPLPPISAKTRSRPDLRNTYILYHNPPPILAKPKVPVVSVLGGLGSRIDELCERVVGRLPGVVHISTCSMLKTRMTIEGFYRMTSVPACAVVDSVLQAMSMVQSASALLVAGFPRSRGDIEEYRSRGVRMDGVVLVDFEEEALRRFLKSEVSSGAIRIGDIESELERYKQDIISVAEYYDEKDILTVVMGDQDTEEMIDDMVMAVDKIIETRKHIQDEDSMIDVAISHECRDTGPRRSLIPTPNGVERPSTVEIRDATEEDIKSIEAASRNSKEDIEVDDKASENDAQEEVGDVSSEKDETGQELNGTQEVSEPGKDDGVEHKQPSVPILFAFENIKTDCETLKDLVVNEVGMCYINFYELVRNDGDKDDRLDTKESLNLLQSVLQRDSVSYASGFFISDFPFELVKETEFEDILKLGDISFVCKVREKSFETEIDESRTKEEFLFESPMSEQVRIIFVTEKNIVEELKSSLQEIVSRADSSVRINEKPQSDAENLTEENLTQETEFKMASASIENVEKVQESIEEPDIIQNPSEVDVASKNESSDSGEIDKSTKDDIELIEGNELKEGNELIEGNEQIEGNELTEGNEEVINQESIKDDEDLTSRDENEESTCQDVEDIITDDTLDDEAKPRGSLQIEETIDLTPKETEDTLSQVSEEGIVSIDAYKPVLARQQNLDVETTSASESTTQLVKDPESGGEGMGNENAEDTEAKTKLKRQETFVSTHATIDESEEPQTDTESNEEGNKTNSGDTKEQEEEIETKTEGVEEQQSENVEKDQTSENGDESILSKTSIFKEEKDSIPLEENKVDPVDNEKQNELKENNSIGDVEGKSEIGRLADKGENECGENEAEKQNEQSEKELNANDDQDVPSEVGDHKNADRVSENVKDETGNEDETKKEESILKDDEETNSKSEIVDETNGTEVETSIQSEKADAGETENKGTDSTEENRTSDQDDENLQGNESAKPKEAINESHASSEETTTDGDSENSQIEASKQEANSDNETNADEEIVTEDKQKEIASEMENNEETTNEESKDANENTANEADGEGIPVEDSVQETDVVPETKVIDNDSDSNDEKSITIETKAEVHAPDSGSPPLVHDTDAVQETNSIGQESEGIQEAEITQETNNVLETKIIQDTDNIPETQGIGEADSIQEQQGTQEEHSVEDTDSELECNLTESHPAVVENENYIIVDTDAMEEDTDLLDCDVNSHTLEESTVTKEIKSETTEESQVTTVHEMGVLRNDRYSAKIQERNGSGILVESRQEDLSGMDEPQERSSSSSRGEL